MIIHNDPANVITAVTTTHKAGTTVELFRRFPLAQHPRDQRILDLTLPPASFAALGEVFRQAGKP